MALQGDMIYRYRGFRNELGWCRIRIYQLASGLTVVVASERPDNPGISITDYTAELASAIRRMYLAPGRAMVWIEHQPWQGRDRGAETFERVLLRWNGERYTEPERRPCTRREVETLIGEGLDGRERAAGGA